jgi:hypothetical protein
MSGNSSEIEFKWSVWNKSPIVSWSCQGVLKSVEFRIPPLSVSHLLSRQVIAVVGSFDEFGAANLLFFSYDGMLEKTFVAPAIGENAQFGAVLEDSNGNVQAIVGCKHDGRWKEVSGCLDTDSGVVENLHRSY